jgi:hypothetical protein
MEARSGHVGHVRTVGGRATVSAIVGLTFGLSLMAIVGLFGPQECSFFDCQPSAATIRTAILVLAAVSPLTAWGVWRSTARRSSWGEASLAAAAAFPLLFFLPGFLSQVTRFRSPMLFGVNASMTVLCPIAAVVAIVAGRKARKEPERPLSGRIGFVLGIVEASLFLLAVLMVWALWDALHETL